MKCDRSSQEKCEECCAQQICSKIENYTCFLVVRPSKNVGHMYPPLLLKCRMSNSNIHTVRRVQVTYSSVQQN